MWYQSIKERMTSYTNEMFNRQDFDKLKELAELRNFDTELLKAKEIFYVGKDIELMLPEYINELKSFGLISNTNNKPIFHQRWVIPIRDTDGKVLNFVGYSNESNERYVYGTSEVYLRRNTLYGLENLNMAYQKGYAILSEGITDAIALHNLGYNIAFGNCGTFRSTVGIAQLKRCKYGVIIIPDRDKAGELAVKEWDFDKYVKINVPIGTKDIDAVLRETKNRETVKDFLEFCIKHLIETPNCKDEITITM